MMPRIRARLVIAAFCLIFAWIAFAAICFAQVADAPHSHAGIPAPRDASHAATAYPKLVDITASTGIQFEHHSSPEQKYIVESMSGGVALIDFDRTAGRTFISRMLKP